MAGIPPDVLAPAPGTARDRGPTLIPRAIRPRGLVAAGNGANRARLSAGASGAGSRVVFAAGRRASSQWRGSLWVAGTRPGRRLSYLRLCCFEYSERGGGVEGSEAAVAGVHDYEHDAHGHCPPHPALAAAAEDAMNFAGEEAAEAAPTTPAGAAPVGTSSVNATGRGHRGVREGSWQESSVVAESWMPSVTHPFQLGLEARRRLPLREGTRLPDQRRVAARRRRRLTCLVLFHPQTHMRRVADVVAVVRIEHVDIEPPVGVGGVSAVLLAAEVFRLVVPAASTHIARSMPSRGGTERDRLRVAVTPAPAIRGGPGRGGVSRRRPTPASRCGRCGCGG